MITASNNSATYPYFSPAHGHVLRSLQRAIQQYRPSPYTFIDEKKLPISKDRILRAIIAELLYAEDERYAFYLSWSMTLLAFFQPHIGDTPVKASSKGAKKFEQQVTTSITAYDVIFENVCRWKKAETANS